MFRHAVAAMDECQRSTEVPELLLYPERPFSLAGLGVIPIPSSDVVMNLLQTDIGAPASHKLRQPVDESLLLGCLRTRVEWTIHAFAEMFSDELTKLHQD